MKRILLVEDNEMNRDMLSRRLARRGYEVITAADGQEALLRVRMARPDIVLMDMNLPVKDGWTTAREMRDDPTQSEIPIIALTAHAMSDDRAKAMAAGCDDYETKPLDFARLLSKIEALLQPGTAK